MEWLMRHNQRVMLQQQEAQFERLRSELVRNNSAPAAQPAIAGDVAGASGQPEPDGGAHAGSSDPALDGGNASGGSKKE